MDIPDWIVDIEPSAAQIQIDYHPDGATISEALYMDSEANTYRTIEWDRAGARARELWHKDGKLHSTDDQPGYLAWHANGVLQSKYWYSDGKSHRTDGPAKLLYYSTGQIASEQWLYQGKFHHTDGPAAIWYDEDGTVNHQEHHEQAL